MKFSPGHLDGIDTIEEYLEFIVNPLPEEIPPITITDITFPDTNSAIITWSATNGVNYTLQSAERLAPGTQSWSDVITLPGPAVAPF